MGPAAALRPRDLLLLRECWRDPLDAAGVGKLAASLPQSAERLTVQRGFADDAWRTALASLCAAVPHLQQLRVHGEWQRAAGLPTPKSMGPMVACATRPIKVVFPVREMLVKYSSSSPPDTLFLEALTEVARMAMERAGHAHVTMVFV